jgi:hypothetical protein
MSPGSRGSGQPGRITDHSARSSGEPRPSGSGDSENLSRVDHRNGSCPRALAGGRLIEHRNPGHGYRLRRSPWVHGRRHAWRGGKYSKCRAGRGDHRRIRWREAHPECRDVLQRHEVGDRRQRHRREGIVGRSGGCSEHRWRHAHVTHYLSTFGNQNSHTISLADRSTVFNTWGWVRCNSAGGNQLKNLMSVNGESSRAEPIGSAAASVNEVLRHAGRR